MLKTIFNPSSKDNNLHMLQDFLSEDLYENYYEEIVLQRPQRKGTKFIVFIDNTHQASAQKTARVSKECEERELEQKEEMHATITTPKQNSQTQEKEEGIEKKESKENSEEVSQKIEHEREKAPTNQVAVQKQQQSYGQVLNQETGRDQPPQTVAIENKTDKDVSTHAFPKGNPLLFTYAKISF